MYSIALLAALVVIIIVSLFIFIRYLEKKFHNISQQALTDSLDKIIALAKDQLGSKQEQATAQLKHERELIEKLVSQIEKQLHHTQQELTQLEKRTLTQYSSLRQSLEEHRRLTGELKVSTDELRKLLSNNQRLGAWGERIAEDILQAAGLQRGIHYEIQHTTQTGRPDIVFKLPDNKIVNVDVKFPFKHLQAWLKTDNPEDKKRHLKKFKEEVKAKIREIKARGYVDPNQGTLDYAIMFIPNEMVFGFINERLGEIIDEAMDNKIILASPFTLYAVARIIFESYRNFYYEKNLRQIVTLINGFTTQWQRFKKDFDNLDALFTKLHQNFLTIKDTRYRLMDSKIQKIKIYQQKQLQTPKTA